MIAALVLSTVAAGAVDFKPSETGFALIANGKPAAVYVDADAEKPVQRVAADFASDLEKVSGRPAQIIHDLKAARGPVVIIGEIGRSPVIDGLVASGKVSADIKGQWEAYRQTVTTVPGVGKALVISGADKRGAVYGTYDISAKMGVSPWYWWADVPVEHHATVTVAAGSRMDKPAVKYRGFFINDEEPALGGWAREKFGGINHKLYEKVFELDLRLKGNYLWPAMWGKAIADDDPETLNTADQYGIVLGTSHHEPMTRAQEEWHRHTDQGVTGGKWDYTKNAENLRTFWRGGMERAKTHDYVVTVGMRGDGDEPMTEGTATQLMETIVADQRKIIADVTGKPPEQTPQVWALYKEVQDYYDHGMKVPDDVTLLFSDDNWGDIRRLPDPNAPRRAGGYGVYYHFDYVGGPRNYKWINTNQIEKTWQQMELAYETGADRLWIVNVGDIKPMEYPLSFFLDMAWNPKAMTPKALEKYPTKWAGQQFGATQAAEIGEILTRYSQYNARRKPELLDAKLFETYPDLVPVSLQYNALARQTDALKKTLPKAYDAAWFQLVEHPVKASANLYDLYVHVARNHMANAQSWQMADTEAAAAKADFATDKALSAQYNSLLGGKWNHMMDQTHIGYTGWQQPDSDVMPQLQTAEAAKASDNRYHYYLQMNATIEPRFGKIYVGDQDGVAIEAEHFARKVDGKAVRWQVIPNLGRTLSSVISLPQAAPATTVADGVRLEYDVKTQKAGDATLKLYLAPTLDTAGKGGLRIAAAVDDRPAETLSFDLRPDKPDWNAAVSNNIHILSLPVKGLPAGRHTIKVYRIDGNVVLERVVLETAEVTLTYLGPPESPTGK
jgi:hypothetical protein